MHWCRAYSARTGNRAVGAGGIMVGIDVLDYSQPVLSKLAFFDSVHPPPLMPRWATALNFVIPTGADPDFLYRGTVEGDVCAFP